MEVVGKVRDCRGCLLSWEDEAASRLEGRHVQIGCCFRVDRRLVVVERGDYSDWARRHTCLILACTS